MVSNLGLALLRNRELRGSTVVGTRQRAHSNFRFRHESSITAMYPPFYRRLEFCNLLIRGLLPEVLIAEPCINFTRCREGFSAGEGKRAGPAKSRDAHSALDAVTRETAKKERGRGGSQALERMPRGNCGAG